jgi:hypothetical protein
LRQCRGGQASGNHGGDQRSDGSTQKKAFHGRLKVHGDAKQP